MRQLTTCLRLITPIRNNGFIHSISISSNLRRLAYLHQANLEMLLIQLLYLLSFLGDMFIQSRKLSLLIILRK